MTVSQDKVVSISYQLNLDAPDGEFVQKVEADDPLAFIYGIGQLLPDFEKNIAGLKVGDGFEFNIPQGYGAFIQENVIDVPISIFVDENGEPVNDILQEGNSIPMQDQQGRPLTGYVLEIGPETVKMDFNHPLAGKDLFFKGEIVDVRDATPEELDHGHVHGPGGHHH
ncbi:MAG: FKBP-type peptidyl-prolyl cis-trans isomerase [Saprospiraceae bacterium]|nr:FKBP-type peptidyl-prolyl cis-trans isomerase [Saprospiraceae bacterium]MCB0624808.1 FKBP-type peptidyl-prolyl cis-trans isomerase [Saprospiraceae bacterium]MCB0676200.1 FKBP-type peptidyl-prolyl cis-trans isomerase [Saprospiraceae bacterium]MCB0681556.1 FKBP-type peptidyl-prolyl cis-trans isomerase [Saprospiraceae bacterium]